MPWKKNEMNLTESTVSFWNSNTEKTCKYSPFPQGNLGDVLLGLTDTVTELQEQVQPKEVIFDAARSVYMGLFKTMEVRGAKEGEENMTVSQFFFLVLQMANKQIDAATFSDLDMDYRSLDYETNIHSKQIGE